MKEVALGQNFISEYFRFPAVVAEAFVFPFVIQKLKD